MHNIFREYFTLFNRQYQPFLLAGFSDKISSVGYMVDKKDTPSKDLSAEWLLRGALTRLGDKFDSLTGRKAVAPSSLATSQLIERLKSLLDSKAKDIPGKGKVIPHNVRLKIQWDKFSTGENDSLERLQRELLAATVDHINDRLYYTLAPIDLQVAPDYFTEGVKLLASFDSFDHSGDDANVNISLPSVPISLSPEPSPNDSEIQRSILDARINLDGKIKPMRLEVPSDGRISVGRTGGNHLVIDDPSISKIHASLSVGPEGDISVSDTGSTNGTFVNGQRMAYGEAKKLSHSDTVSFGSVEVTFEVQNKPADSEHESADNAPDNNKTAIAEFEFTSRSSETTKSSVNEKVADGETVNESGKS